jgi:hypothetical protein
MSIVEVRLPTSELSKQMATMRMWLDEQRFEPSRFACRKSRHGVSVSLEFKITHQAQEFAQRFGGRAAALPAAQPENEAAGKFLKVELPSQGIVGSPTKGSTTTTTRFPSVVSLK